MFTATRPRDDLVHVAHRFFFPLKFASCSLLSPSSLSPHSHSHSLSLGATVFSLLQLSCNPPLEAGPLGDASSPWHAGVSGRAADKRWGGHGPWGWPAIRGVSESGGHRAAGQRTLYGHEEAPGGSARTLHPAPPHRHTLQPAAGPGHTKVHSLEVCVTAEGRDRCLKSSV